MHVVIVFASQKEHISMLFWQPGKQKYGSTQPLHIFLHLMIKL